MELHTFMGLLQEYMHEYGLDVVVLAHIPGSNSTGAAADQREFSRRMARMLYRSSGHHTKSFSRDRNKQRAVAIFDSLV